MKKILLLAFTIVSLNAFALSVNIGASYTQPRYVDSTNIFDVVTGSSKGNDYDAPVYAANLEVTQGFVIGEVGLGASYEQGYKRGTEQFDAIPVYGLVRLNLFPIAIKPYVNAKYGTTLYTKKVNTDITGGQYLSLGVGLTVLDSLQVEGNLSANESTRNGTKMYNGSYGLSFRYVAF